MAKRPSRLSLHNQMLQSALLAILAMSALSVGLFLLRFAASGSIRYWFLTWNLALAWLPLIIVYYLHFWLKRHAWQSWGGVLLTLLWLGFLPNSFYLASDLIHLHESGEVSILFDVVMFCAFIAAGLINGFLSLIIMHHNLLLRLRHRVAHAAIALVLLASSFAIYIGRSRRWHTWDVLANPFGLLFDLSEQFNSSTSSVELAEVTLLFFALLGTLYFVVWQGFAFIRKASK